MIIPADRIVEHTVTIQVVLPAIDKKESSLVDIVLRDFDFKIVDLELKADYRTDNQFSY